MCIKLVEKQFFFENFTITLLRRRILLTFFFNIKTLMKRYLPISVVNIYEDKMLQNSQSSPKNCKMGLGAKSLLHFWLNRTHSIAT